MFFKKGLKIFSHFSLRSFADFSHKTAGYPFLVVKNLNHVPANATNINIRGPGRLDGTDYLYIVDLKKNSRCLPPARLLSPDRVDMDCGIDPLSREI